MQKNKKTCPSVSIQKRALKLVLCPPGCFFLQFLPHHNTVKKLLTSHFFVVQFEEVSLVDVDHGPSFQVYQLWPGLLDA